MRLGMRAVRGHQTGAVEEPVVEELPLPAPAAGEVLSELLGRRAVGRIVLVPPVP